MDAGAAPSSPPHGAAQHGAGGAHRPPVGASEHGPRDAVQYVPLAAGAIAFAGYAVSAARTITWWDGSSYPLAAITLGIPGTPGSLLLVLLGWLVSRVPLVRPVAFQLNLLAALIAAMLVGLLSWL